MLQQLRHYVIPDTTQHHTLDTKQFRKLEKGWTAILL